MKIVVLEDIAEALEATFDEWEQFLNTETGEIVSLPNDSAFMDEELEELAEEIDSSDAYVRLPNQYDLHEYKIMERFAEASPDERKSEALLYALHGRKPYRHFKDRINDFGIADEYYAFRLLAFCDIAKEWCEENEIPYRSK